MACPFCAVPPDEILLAGDLCLFMDTRDPVLVGSGMIVPRAHRETVFDLTAAEWSETFVLLHRARALLDDRYRPDGYNVGWNSGAVGGQEVFHAHLHVIPRFADEPLAGRGIRYALKQPTNRRGVEQNLNQPSPGATTTGTYHVGAALEWRPRTDASPRGEVSD